MNLSQNEGQTGRPQSLCVCAGDSCDAVVIRDDRSFSESILGHRCIGNTYLSPVARHVRRGTRQAFRLALRGALVPTESLGGFRYGRLPLLRNAPSVSGRLRSG